MTTIVSIYQAGESLYELFDKVCVINEGRMAYFGPASRARQYFIDMGYQPANRQTTSDFLVSGACPSPRLPAPDIACYLRKLTIAFFSSAVTDPNGRTVREGYEQHVPRTAAEFADYFKRSELGKLNVHDIESYNEQFVGKAELVDEYIKSSYDEHVRCSNKKSPYIISIPMQVRALMVRRWQIIQGSYQAQLIQLSYVVSQCGFL